MLVPIGAEEDNNKRKETGIPFFGQVPQGFPHDRFNNRVRKEIFMNVFIVLVLIETIATNEIANRRRLALSPGNGTLGIGTTLA
ncbi:hypothetical protein EHQ79_00130 [Leptospira jelokensis]|nr:hypothetical protein EHQ79_00130 [Leptospira jelokensis]